MYIECQTIIFKALCCYNFSMARTVFVEIVHTQQTEVLTCVVFIAQRLTAVAVDIQLIDAEVRMPMTSIQVSTTLRLLYLKNLMNRMPK